MGSFPGHVLPGTLFLVVGMWHMWCSIVRYISDPKSFQVRVWNPVPGFDGRLKYLELYVIAIGGFIDLCIEFLFATHLKIFVNGVLNPSHMNNFEHSGMLLMFLIFGVIALLSEKTSFLPLPEGALCLIASAAFTAECLLFNFHSTTHMGLEGYYHRILVLLIALCILSTIAGALIPASFPADLCSGIAITLQGLWFYQTAFTLYGPMIPDGCQLKGDKIVCSSNEHEIHGELLANFQLFALVFGVLASVAGAYIYAEAKYGGSSETNLPSPDEGFIPNRSAMDFDYARYMLTCRGGIVKDNVGPSPSSKLLYRKHLAEILNMNRTRILAFKNKAPQSNKNLDDPFQEQGTPNTQSIKKRRLVSQSPERVLDAPDIVDDFYLNLLDWSCNNVIAIALGNSVYLWAASDGSTSELLSANDDIGPVTSLKWAPDGRYLAVGFNNSHVQLWDSATTRLLRTLQGGHRLRVSSVDWNEHILTTGGMDSMIINNDVRIRSHIVSRYRGHSEEVCGLTWCSSGRQLASGGNDNLVHIWCASMASSNQWLHCFNDHSAAVKALSWCPFQSNLLASGGGVGDSCIKFWNTNSGACLNSVNTRSQVCSLLWSTHERELLSGHGYNAYQLALWKYPSMVKIAELYGHTSRVLSMAKSPDGHVASVAGDEMLRIWNVFGTPPLTKPGTGMKQDLFPNIPRIR